MTWNSIRLKCIPKNSHFKTTYGYGLDGVCKNQGMCIFWLQKLFWLNRFKTNTPKICLLTVWSWLPYCFLSSWLMRLINFVIFITLSTNFVRDKVKPFEERLRWEVVYEIWREHLSWLLAKTMKHVVSLGFRFDPINQKRAVGLNNVFRTLTDI